MVDNFVTGANGFIGKHLTKRLDECLDETVTVRHDDIAGAVFEDCDRFFFLSTYGNMNGQTDTSEILRANIGNLGYALACYIEESKCESFVFVSSSSVNLPVQTPYSHAKRAGEEMVLASGIQACAIRLYSVTGVGEQPEHLIPTLIRSCLEGKQVTLAASPTHDFIDVADVVDGLIALADSHVRGIFEFGSGLATTNSEVLNLVEEICGKKANIIFSGEGMRPYDNLNWCCKDFRASRFGWAPKKSLAHSIQDMVEVYKFLQNDRP